jgi:sigma-54 dependent transcriptional regulator, acetoin dehydrogenase operon transcriptional activator AcoR
LQKEKIIELLLKGLSKDCVSNGRTEPFEIMEEALSSLEAYDWYGNYRELQNFATCLAVECLDDEIISLETVERVMRKRINYSRFGKSNETASEVSNLFATNLVTVTFDPKTDDLDSIYLKAAGNVIEKVLSENNGNLRRAARKMGVTHSTLSRILKKFKAISEDKMVIVESETAPTYMVTA